MPVNKFIVKDMHDYEVLEDYFNKEDIQGVLKGLHHWDRDLRDRAAFYLGELGDQEAIEPLIKAIKADDKYGITIPATKALAKIGGDRAIKIILKHSKDKAYWIRRTAAESLGILGNKKGIKTLSRLANDKNQDVRIAAIHALGKIHDNQAIKPLIRVWKKYHKKRGNEASNARKALSNITAGSSEAYDLVVHHCKELENIVVKPSI